MALLVTSSIAVTKDEVNGEKTVNQYRILGEAGRGTFCKVKWAEDGNKQRYAVKVLSKTAASRQYVAHFTQEGATTITLRARIDEELRILGSLSHRGVLPLLEVIDDPSHDTLYIVMEGLLGGQLMTWSDRNCAYTIKSDAHAVQQMWGGEVSSSSDGPAAEPCEVVVYQEGVASYLFRQLLEAADYLHSQGVIHKDIKPDNILLTLPVPTADARFVRLLSLAGWPAIQGPRAVSGKEAVPDAAAQDAFQALLAKAGLQAKIGDFNSSVSCEQPDCLIHDAQGTQQFTPPECFESQPGGVQGKPRDMWSLGCVLFTMLCGRCPFFEEEPIMLQLLVMDYKDQLPLPAGIASPAADSLLRAIIARDPTRRPSASAALQHAWLQGAGA